jgi:hypothetical protein
LRLQGNWDKLYDEGFWIFGDFFLALFAVAALVA